MEKSEACVACSEASWHLLGKKDNYELFRCKSCGTISILPAPRLPISLYDKNYFCAEYGGSGYVNYDEDKEAMRPELNNALDILESHIAQISTDMRGNFLDIGAATGFFMDLAKQRGWRVSGVEVSDYAAAIARGKDLDVVTGTILDTKKTSQYDVVSLWDVIEHLPDPVRDINIVASLLKKDGLCLIVTPDASSLYARLRGLSWHLLVPPEHINCFSRNGLSQLLLRCGFEVISITTPTKKFPLAYSLHVISRVTGISFLDLLARKLSGTWLGRLLVPLNVRDNMQIIARKK